MNKPCPFYIILLDYLLDYMISIIVPIFNEEQTVGKLHWAIVDAMKRQSDRYEIIFVNDGSSDRTYEIAKHLKPLKLISLQRNYGETPALDVGIQEASGDIIVFLDADLQNDPADIPLLLKKIEEGYDVVAGWRKSRKDDWTRILFSHIANSIVSFILGVHLHDFGCGLKAYRAKFIKDFRLWGGAQVFLPAIAKERGARICEVQISHRPREFGSSKIRILNMLTAGFDLLSIAFFVKYFSKPLRFFGGWGFVSIILSVTAFGVAIALRLLGVEDFTATPLPVVGTLFAILGVLLFMMGLLAEILLRTYYATVNKSPYIIGDIKENK